MSSYSYENIGGNIKLAVTNEHTFGTDSFLLSYFAKPKKKDKVCDLGTGCGIIPFLWFRTDETSPSKAWGIDVQKQAIDQISDSLKNSSVESFTPILADFREIKAHLPAGSMDLVTCNPPYKAQGTGVMSQSESDRIARHETLGSLDDVCRAAAWLLRFNGRFCLCQLVERLPDVVCAMRNNGIEPKRMRFVQNTIDAPPYLVLVEGSRGGKPFMKVEPSLVLRENDKTSKEMGEVYGMYGKVEV